MSIPKKADVVIVGAGVAGLYTAWRILQQHPKKKILIVERLNRTGGRLDSDLIKIENDTHTGFDTVRDEEGGMRFNYGMEELMQVFGALHLCDQIVPFPMVDPNNHFYLRGHSFTVAEAEDSKQMIWSDIYNLAASEIGKNPSTILSEAFNIVLSVNGVHTLPDPTPEFWQRVRLEMSWKGTKLNEWQLWGLLRDIGYSEECIDMLSHTIGFEAPFRDVINAGEAFQLLGDFPSNPSYHTLRDGFSTLPNALVAALSEYPGCKISLSTSVNSIAGKSGKYEVALSVGKPGESYRDGRKSNKSYLVTAPQVVLAIAANAMEKLYHDSPALKTGKKALQFLQDIRSIVSLRLLKINLYYELPWWENGLDGQQPNHYGPNFTDLPLNSAYPFYNTNGVTGDRPAALTIYCDYSNTNFWQGLQNVGPMFDSPLQREHSQPPQVLFPASEAVVREAGKQLRLLFNTPYVPEPIMTSYRLWGGEDDFGYAYHQWGIGADDAGVMKRMTEPVPGIFTCNEAWSDMQGWVNGSLRSADLVLKKMKIKALKHDPCPAPPKQ